MKINSRRAKNNLYCDYLECLRSLVKPDFYMYLKDAPTKKNDISLLLKVRLMDSGKKKKELILVITSWIVIAIFVGNLSYLPTTMVDTKPIPQFYEENVVQSTIPTPTKN